MNEFHISYHISISLLPWWKPSPRRRSSVLSVSLSPIFPILSSLLSSLVLTAASVLTNYSVWGWCRVSPERDFSQQLCKQTKPIRTFLLPPTRSLQPGHVTIFSNHISTRICAYYFSNISCLHTYYLVWWPQPMTGEIIIQRTETIQLFLQTLSNQHNSLHKLKFTLLHQAACWESCNIHKTSCINQNISLCKHDILLSLPR